MSSETDGSKTPGMMNGFLNAKRELSHPFAMGVNMQKAQKAALQLASFLIQDSLYRKNLIVRARAGTLPPNIEMMLWHYILGKPVEQINITTDAPQRDMSEMTDTELKDEIFQLRLRAEALMEKKAALDG